MFILKNYNCGQQLMGDEVLSHALNSGTAALKSETAALKFETAAVAETSNASPGDFIGWRNTPITEIDIRTFNSFRFSSEYHDDELNLIYYNYRHYDPATGRFLSRDPIEEQGGANPYNFTANNPINFIDMLGLKDCIFVYFAGVHGFDAEGKLKKNIGENKTRLEGCWSTGCNVFFGNNILRDYYNNIIRPEGASLFDDSYAGFGPNASKPSGNRGFNNPFFMSTKSKKHQASRSGYVAMMKNDWDALVKSAEEAAEDCECKCKNIRVVFDVAKKDKNGFNKKTNGTGFSIPTEKKIICKKNKKEGKKK